LLEQDSYKLDAQPALSEDLKVLLKIK